MKLNYCTITGADDAVDPHKLAEMSAKYPFVEWAILNSINSSGAPRFPTPEWIVRFHKACPDVAKSMHLCDQVLRNFMNGDPQVAADISLMPRVQLNFGFNFDMHDARGEAVAKRIAAFPDKQFIFQYSDQTRPLLPFLSHLPNIAILHDASAGRGERPDTWPAPLPGFHCGYAGGIGPENVGDVLDGLSKMLPPEQRTWIDMETRVRTGNQFDLNKVRHVLEIVKAKAFTPEEAFSLTRQTCKL